jgi:hypothetical protein
MKIYGGVEVYLYPLKVVVQGPDLMAQHTYITSRETAPGTYYTGGWVSPRAGVNFMEERNPI